MAYQPDLKGARGGGHPAHPDCWVCSPHNPFGLQIDFTLDTLGGVSGTFPCPAAYTGYPGLLHGGVISSLLDGAMTNCLLARGISGVTADLQIRFRQPVKIQTPVTVRAWVQRSRRLVYELEAELVQDGQVCNTAKGRFMAHPQAVPDDNPPPKGTPS